MRAFFAIEPDEALRAEAQAVARAWRERISRHARARADAGARAKRGERAGLRWVRPEGWHVTLRFLGSVAADELGGLALRAREALAEHSPFAIRLGAARLVPRRNPSVLALAVEPHEPLEALASALERVAVACGLDPDARRFLPHLTLARVKRAKARSLDPDGLAAAGEARQCVDEIVLLRSDLDDAGATYTPLERIALAGHPAGATCSGTPVHP